MVSILYLSVTRYRVHGSLECWEILEPCVRRPLTVYPSRGKEPAGGSCKQHTTRAAVSTAMHGWAWYRSTAQPHARMRRWGQEDQGSGGQGMRAGGFPPRRHLREGECLPVPVTWCGLPWLACPGLLFPSLALMYLSTKGKRRPSGGRNNRGSSWENPMVFDTPCRMRYSPCP